jgi:hypothetical protein
MSEGKTVILLLLWPFAWLGMVHAIDRLAGIYLEMRVKRRMVNLMAQHRALVEKYERKMLLDEIDEITGRS